MPILFIIDPPHSLHLKKDSTFALMKEAIKQNHQVYFCLQHDLYIDANQLFCRTHRFEVNIFPNHAKTYETHPVSFFNALFMRKDPPVDQAYLHTTFLLDIAEKSNVKVFNKPSSIRSWNEKISILQFDELIPKTLVTANPEIVKQFFRDHGDIILKPLDGMGGKNIFRVSEFEKNLNVILEIMTNHGHQTAKHAVAGAADENPFLTTCEVGAAWRHVVRGVARSLCDASFMPVTHGHVFEKRNHGFVKGHVNLITQRVFVA